MFVLTLFLLISCHIWSQKIAKFRTVATYSSDWIDKTGKWGSWNKNPNSDGILVVFDLDKRNITTYGKMEMTFSIIQEKEEELPSELSDVFIRHKLLCVDDQNMKCDVYVQYAKDSSEQYDSIFIFYSLQAFRFKLIRQ